MHRATSLALAAALIPGTYAHMSIWLRSMYGVSSDWQYPVGDPVHPIGPNIANQDDWWFRGPSVRNLPPPAGAVTDLPAGGTLSVQMACHVAWTSFGVATTANGSQLDACPGNPGAYHTFSTSMAVDEASLSGCALGIADVDDISKVTMDNLAIFSVNSKCIKQKWTDFEIPAEMPKCTGSKCICGWFWLANEGIANFYMTPFDCSVSGSPADATPIMAPVDPVWHDPSTTGWTVSKGAKRPLYAYNTPTNIVWKGNDDRPGYHANWDFNDGAQHDIFEPKSGNTSSSAAPVASAVSSVVSVASSVVSSAASQASVVVSSAVAAASSAVSHATVAAAAAKTTAKAATRSALTAKQTTKGRTAVTKANKKDQIVEARHPRQFTRAEDSNATASEGESSEVKREVVEDIESAMVGRDLVADKMFDV